MVAFSPKAALCTFVVVAGFGVAVTSQLPGGLFGLIGMERDGLFTMQGGAGAPDEDERSEIVSAVLTHEAQQTARGPVCVELSDEGEALAGERLEIARLQRNVADAPQGMRASSIAALDLRRRPERVWLLASPGADENPPLGEESVRQLRAAEAAVLGGPLAGPVDITLDMGALPESLRSDAPGCPTLAFTAPAVAGEIAFVETSFTRAGQPAVGRLYAVARSGGRWRVEGVARQ